MKNAIVTFVEEGGFLASDEGKKLILSSSIQDVGNAVLDSEIIFDQLGESLKSNSNSRDDFSLTVRATEILAYMEQEYLRRKRFEAFKTLKSR